MAESDLVQFEDSSAFRLACLISIGKCSLNGVIHFGQYFARDRSSAVQITSFGSWVLFGVTRRAVLCVLFLTVTQQKIHGALVIFHVNFVLSYFDVVRVCCCFRSCFGEHRRCVSGLRKWYFSSSDLRVRRWPISRTVICSIAASYGFLHFRSPERCFGGRR
ncbi:hypothetical protein RvY_09986 [Ramazzottius varieornatus]|uniref:Uncharacterized protein n=1 Tax=Ramazzottius varieornatus TaxID=947166 RepID=A0A1D1VDD8_RAMVA|nr:hypothetical protein RvY_09986 [Ramazzottius varieornatus]